MIERPSTALGNITDLGEVEAQVTGIVRGFAPAHDMSRVNEGFALLRSAFAGELSGYAPLQTLYHNRIHTNEVVLCTARMLHGLQLSGQGLNGHYIDAALIGALMHDIGYLMKHSELRAGESNTGAQYTATHVVRGVEFVREQLAHLPHDVLASTVKVIQVTDHRQHPDWVKFDNAQEQLAAYATATSDLVGQMANREYLERLLFLYLEFQEAKMGGFADVHDLLEKTASFYRITRHRLDKDLNGLTGHLERHFAQATGEGRNFYLESIERNLDYLTRLIREERDRRFEMLKRGGVVERVIDEKGAALK